MNLPRSTYQKESPRAAHSRFSSMLLPVSTCLYLAVSCKLHSKCSPALKEEEERRKFLQAEHAANKPCRAGQAPPRLLYLAAGSRRDRLRDHGNGYTTIIQSVENRGVSPAMHPHRPQNQTTLRPHVAKPVKTYLETLKWEVLPQPPYSPDIAPSDFHLFRSMAHGLAQKWIDSWIASKDMSFFHY
ncbi:MOS1T transposase, partial [Pseudoatta argentina]